MKKILLYLIFTLPAMTYTLPGEFILKKMAQNAVCGKAKFKGSIKEDSEEKKLVEFTDLVLDQGILLGDKELELGFFQTMLKCKQNILQAMKDYLATMGVDYQKVAHGIFNYEPVFRLGADIGRSSPVELWVEKKYFLPVKEISKDYERSYEHWFGVYALKNKRLPRVIKSKQKTITIAEEITL